MRPDNVLFWLLLLQLPDHPGLVSAKGSRGSKRQRAVDPLEAGLNALIEAEEARLVLSERDDDRSSRPGSPDPLHRAIRARNANRVVSHHSKAMLSQRSDMHRRYCTSCIALRFGHLHQLKRRTSLHFRQCFWRTRPTQSL